VLQTTWDRQFVSSYRPLVGHAPPSREEAHSTMTKLDNPMSFKRLGGRACLACVSSSPSKIPYGGFSPVRLQTGCQPQPSPSRAYMRPPAHAPALPGFRRSMSAPGRSPEHSGPEALGSPAGYSVPPGLRLLWPHPSLSVSPADLGLRLIRSVFALRAEAERFPNLLCVSVLSVPSSVPRRTGRWATVRSPPVLAFAGQ